MTDPNPTATCRHCRFWEEAGTDDGVRFGLCRRNPPSYEGWPMTRDKDWCGEFSAARPI